MRARRKIFNRWQNWVGLLLAALFFITAAAAPLLSPEDPNEPGPFKHIGRITEKEPRPPSAAAPLGTTRDRASVYHTLVWGTRSALVFGLATALFTAALGIVIGATSGYFGGRVNGLLMRVTDSFLAFPLIAGVVFTGQLITITLNNAGVISGYSGYGPFTMVPDNLPQFIQFLRGVDPVMVAFIVFSWTPYARIMNTLVQRIMNTEYIQAALALGSSHRGVIFRHLIPNAIAPVIVLGARDVGGMVLLHATFTFIGLGGVSPWGLLLAQGRDYIIGPGGGIFHYWWLFLPITLALMLFGVTFDLLGDLLTDFLDPRTR